MSIKPNNLYWPAAHVYLGQVAEERPHWRWGEASGQVIKEIIAEALAAAGPLTPEDGLHLKTLVIQAAERRLAA